MKTEQVTIDPRVDQKPCLKHFIVGCNQAAIAAIKNMMNQHTSSAIYLSGLSGVGKSHLLQSVYHHMQSLGLHVQYIDPLTTPDISITTLPHVGKQHGYLLDHFDHLMQCKANQSRFIDFFNTCVTQGSKLMIAARQPPEALQDQLLPDCYTRLRQMLCYVIQPLDDAQKMQALYTKLIQKGIQLNSQKINYLMDHAPRDMRSLNHILTQLDSMSLTHQKPISFAMIKDCLSGQ